MNVTILIVDDEEPVRRTFREWLESAQLGCTLLAAADAEEALKLANQHAIDLAILDWNLGAGNDGLQLLEDLYLFNPSVVAIMITGYAHQATPLDALRMGVRDYLDKNQDLGRETFLAAVRRQLEYIRPAKREREVHQSLLSFRETLEKVLPLVESAAALNDPVPLPEAIHRLMQFLLRLTRARDGVLLVRRHDPANESADVYRAHGAGGALLQVELVPFARSLAGTVTSMQQPCAMVQLDRLAREPGTELQPFERGRQSLLAVPLAVAPGIQVILELFDKEEGAGGFTPEDQQLAGAAADFGVELLRQALAEGRSQRVLLDAMAAAVKASATVTESLRGTPAQRLEQPPPSAVLETMRQGLGAALAPARDAEATLRLAEAIRVLALRHGEPALQHCLTLIENLRGLLDSVSGYRDAVADQPEEPR